MGTITTRASTSPFDPPAVGPAPHSRAAHRRRALGLGVVAALLAPGVLARAGDGPEQRVAGAQTPAAAQDPGRRPPSRERFPDWEARDDEGRWALWVDDRRRLGPDALPAWIEFLAAERQHALLEWLVLTEESSADATAALLAAGAPNGLRTAAWSLALRDRRERGDARTALESRAGEFLGWAAREPRDALPATARALVLELEAAGAQPARTGLEAAPGLTADHLFGALGKAAACVPFGRRLAAQPGVAYDQVVLRAIATSSRLEDGGGARVRAQLLTVGTEGSGLVARHAFLCFTRFAPPFIPARELALLADDAAVEGSQREVALLAASYAAWPEASLALHRHAFGDPGEPTWHLAWSRLVELGDDFTLARVEEGSPPAAEAAARFRAERLHTLVERLDARRAASPEQARDYVVLRSTEWLERLALATLREDPLRDELEAWTFAVLSSPGAELRERLLALADGYRSELEPDDAPLRTVLEELVRQWARDLAG